MKLAAILLAAGSGVRLGKKTPKAFIKVKKREIFRYSLDKFNKIAGIKDIILTVPQSFTAKKIDSLRNKLKKYRKLNIIKGGEKRADSVRIAVENILSKPDFIIIHDCARPLITDKTIRNAIKTAYTKGNCVVGYKLSDSIKKYKGNKLVRNLDRKNIFVAETPQIFRFNEFRKFIRNNSSRDASDDSFPLINHGKKVFYEVSDSVNIKITTNRELNIFKRILFSDD